MYLIAPTVENNGVIRADNGDILLAAGKRVEVVAGASPYLRVEIDNPEGAAAVNVGELVGRHVSLYGTALRNGGVISADTATITASGSIVLRASRDATLEAGSRVTANGANGGTVRVEAGGTLLVDGVIEARGATGKGGDVQLLGTQVGLVGAAMVDASGASGGGTILAGGDFQGANAAVRNAKSTFVSSDATLRADATADGDGGRVIVWSDEATRYYGAASARGGTDGGNGGLIEVSGKQYLDFAGNADTRAPRGTTGLLLLDPSNVNITTTADAFVGGTFTGGQFGGAAGTATITWSTIDAQLASNNVVITTSGSGGAGNITVVNASPVLNRANDLWLVANNAITVSGAITNAGAGGLRMYAGWNGTAFTYPTVPTLAASTTADIAVNAPISMVGNVLMAASDTITVTRDIAVSGANRGITLRADADNNAAGNLVIQSAAVANTAAVTAADGAITLSGFDVSVLGGAAAGRNALVSAGGAGGTLDLRSRRDLVIQGGAGGATATVQSAGAQTVAAGRNMTVAGGTSANSSGVLQLTADAAQTIDVAGALTVRGSNTANANDAKGIIAGRGVQSIDVGGTFTLAGGTAAGTGKNGVVSNAPGAGAGSTVIRAVTDFTETNPSATARAWLGTEGTGAFGDVDVSILTGNSVNLTSSLSVGGTRSMVLTGDAAFAAGALWGANQFYAGSPASAVVAANAAGNIAISAPVGPTTLQTADGAIALTAVNISAAGGAAAGRSVLVDAQGANGTLDVTARANLTITGGTAADVTAAMQSAAAQNIAAGGGLTITAGTANGANATLAVTTDVAQTIDVGGTLTVRGNTAGTPTGSIGRILGRGTQSIDANAIAITSGTGGTGNHALIDNQPGAGAGTTTIRANTTITETNNAGGRAFIGDTTGTLGNVNVDLQAGGNIAITSSLVVGGTADIAMAADAAFAAGQLWAANRFFAGSAQSAAVASNNAGNLAFTAPVAATTVQTTDGSIALSGVNVSFNGGAAAGRNLLVNAQGAGGTLDVLARHTVAGSAGDLAITGGTAAGVTATLQSSGAQTLGATRDVTVAAGTAANTTATLQVTADAAQSIDVGRNLVVRGSNTANANDAKGVIAGRGAQAIDVGGSFTIAGGTAAGTNKNGVVTNAPGAGTGSTVVRVAGAFAETNNGANRAWLGADGSGAFGDVGVNVQAGGNVAITSSLGVGGTAGIGMTADAAFAAGDLWAANRFFAGSAASAAVASNAAGDITFTAPVAATTVQTTDGAIALSGVNITATGGAAAGRNVLVNAQGANGTLDVTARTNVSITGGTFAGVTAAMQSAGAQNVAAGGNLTLTGGNFNNATATLAVTADAAQSIDVGGALTLQAGTGVTGSIASIRGRGAQSIDVGGNVALNAGATGTGNNAVIDNAPAGAGSTTLRARGNITETNNAGGRAWLGAAGSGAFTNVAVDVQAAGDITLASGISSNVANALAIGADAAFAAGDLWAANRFFAGSAASAASVSNGLGGVLLVSGPAASSIALTTVSGPLSVVSAARNAANTADVDATLGTALNQLALTSASGSIAVGDSVVTGAGNRSFRNVTVANPVSTAGSVTLEANNALTLNAFVTGNAGVTLAADADASGAGALALNAGVTTTTGSVVLGGVGVTQAAATVVDAGVGTITVDANDGAIGLAGTLTTVNAGAGAIVLRDATTAALGNVSAVNGTVVLGLAGADNLSGNVTQNVGTAINAGGLAGVVGGNAALGNGNDFTGAAGVQAGGNVRLNDVNALIVGPTSAGGTVLATAGGNLTLGGNVGAAGAGDAVVLAAGVGAAFLNPGANTIATPSGRWLVYSSAPAANAFGGLASGQQALWNRTHPAAVPEAGNRYVFAIQPTVTVTSTDVTKSYGTDVTATVAAAFTTAGFVDASLYGNVFTQDTAANALTGSVTSAGSAATAGVAGSPYATNVAFTSATGYGVSNDAAGRVFVNPAALTLTANDATKIYGADGDVHRHRVHARPACRTARRSAA